MQTHGYTLDPIYLMSPDINLDTAISYSIYAENAPGVYLATKATSSCLGHFSCFIVKSAIATDDKFVFTSSSTNTSL